MPARRRSDDGRPFPRHLATSDYEYDDEETEFLKAVDQYKTATGHRFPTYSEIFNLIRKLGYAKHDFHDVVDDPTVDRSMEGSGEMLIPDLR